MEIFFNDPRYKEVKLKYEKQYFKLFGSYAYFNGNKLDHKSKSEMEEYFKNKKVTIEVTEESMTKKGIKTSISKTVSKSFYQIWSEDPDMREYNEVVFDCNLDRVKKHQFNLFTSFNHLDDVVLEKEIDLEPIFEHMRSLHNYIEEDFKYTICYLAQLVQYPETLPHISLVFISEEGVGKDLWGSFISNVIGEHYCHNTEKLDLICDKFNSILAGKLLMIINETNPVESRDRLENIKFLITAEDVTIRALYKDPIKCKNFCRFIFFSNRLFAFPVEESARRPKIVQSSDKYLAKNIGIKANNEYFTKLRQMYKDPKYQKAFLNYLLKYDISQFNPKKFEKSILHKELEDTSVSPIVGFLADLVSNNIDENSIKYSASEITSMLKSYLHNLGYKYDFTPSKLSVELTMNYQIKKSKCSCIMYTIDIKALKKLLEEKYKYNFDSDDNNTEKPKEEEFDIEGIDKLTQDILNLI